MGKSGTEGPSSLRIPISFHPSPLVSPVDFTEQGSRAVGKMQTNSLSLDLPKANPQDQISFQKDSTLNCQVLTLGRWINNIQIMSLR